MNGPKPSQRLAAEHQARWEAVERARTCELAGLTPERAFEMIRSLRPFASVPANPFNGLGLVEQQAIFHRRKRQ
jgi:hypothetical protein